MNERDAAYWDGSEEGKCYVEADERQSSERMRERGEGERERERKREREREMSTDTQGL